MELYCVSLTFHYVQILHTGHSQMSVSHRFFSRRFYWGIGGAAVIGGLVCMVNVPELMTSSDASSPGPTVAVAPEARSLDLHSEGIRQALQGNYPQAITQYDQALALSPQNPEIYYNRAVAYYSLGDADLAIKDFDHAIQLQPTMAEAYANRSTVYLDMGDPARALADGQQAATLFDSQSESQQAEEVRQWLKEQSIQAIP